MFNELKSFAQRVETGEVDQQAVGQAAQDRVADMDHDEVAQHVQTAANNAQQNGDQSLAQQLMGLVENHGSGGDLKQQVVSLVTSNPQILQHFAPEFAKGILSKL